MILNKASNGLGQELGEAQVTHLRLKIRGYRIEIRCQVRTLPIRLICT